VFRTPLYPIDFIFQLFCNHYVDEDDLKRICQRNLFKEALFLASPELQKEIEKWMDGKLTDAKKAQRLKGVIIRYLTRMSSRCTPFGLFAGISIGQWGVETDIRLECEEKIIQHTRLDMNYLCSLSQELGKKSSIRRVMNYYTNSSLYRVANKIRYVEYNYVDGKRNHQIVAVENNEYLEKIIKEAEKGISYNELVNLLTQNGIGDEDANAYLDDLINSQILIGDIEPAITDNEYLQHLISILYHYNQKDDHVGNILEKVNRQLKKIDDPDMSTTINNYEIILEQLDTLGIEIKPGYLFQTDMVRPTLSCSLNKSVSDDILKGVEILSKLTIPYYESNLTKFREEFQKRYETREIPLLKALDKEMGIGYGDDSFQGDVSSLVDDIHLPEQISENFTLDWNPVSDLLLKKIIEAGNTNSLSVEITNNDLKELQAHWEYQNDTFFTLVKILDRWPDNKERYQILIDHAGGSSAANLLGRFCWAHSEVHEMVKMITTKEQEFYKESLIAEIVHLPESRTGNVLLRPAFREYEISYLSRPGVSNEYCIKPEDLFLSIKNNRIFLRSKKLNKEIIPRQTTAHNFSRNALPVYQFLCDLQYQDHIGNVSFSWGPLNKQFDFLPRVTYKNLVFSLATWKIYNKEIKDITSIKEDDQLMDQITRWRKVRNIPKWTLLVDFDNELLINLENIDSIRVLLSLVKNRVSFQLNEFLFNPDNLIVNDGNKTFTNEFIFTFYKCKDIAAKSPSR